MNANTIASRLLISARKRAARIGVPYALGSLGDNSWLVYGLRRGTCELTGLSFEYSTLTAPGPRGDRQVPHPLRPSIDRIDARQGYVPGNVRLVTWQCNLALFVWGDDYFKDMCAAVSKRPASADAAKGLPPRSSELLKTLRKDFPRGIIHFDAAYLDFLSGRFGWKSGNQALGHLRTLAAYGVIAEGRETGRWADKNWYLLECSA